VSAASSASSAPVPISSRHIRALIYQGPNQKALDQRPKPEIKAATDAIVRVMRTTICGTDLHILKGDVASCEHGRPIET
jgi:alcohol dehydrogenase